MPKKEVLDATYIALQEESTTTHWAMGHQANRHQRSCLNQTNSPVCVHPLTRKGYAQFLSGTSSFTHCIASQTWRIISGFASGILVPHVLPRITHSHVFLHRCTLSSLFLVANAFVPTCILSHTTGPRPPFKVYSNLTVISSVPFIHFCCYLKRTVPLRIYLY